MSRGNPGSHWLAFIPAGAGPSTRAVVAVERGSQVNVPTSLIVVLLVAAWLVVLLPMVARSRERVPETDDQAAGFRVLRRASASLRARSAAARRRGRVGQLGGESADRSTDHAVDQPAVHRQGPWDAEEDSMTQVVQGEQGHEPTDAAEEWAEAQAAAQRRAGRRGASPLQIGNGGNADTAGPALALADRPDLDQDADHRHDSRFDHPHGDPVSDHRGDDHTDAADHRVGQATDHHDLDEDHTSGDRWDASAGSGADPQRLRPRRAGRGGYDPEADEATRQYRYAQRRRVSFGLLLITVAFAVLALVLLPGLWIGAAVTGLLLLGYLLYLRRQVKIEADVRRRRLERLARARQIRPEYEPPRMRSAQPGAPVSRHHTRRVVVDLDDEDPGFDDLEQYQPVEYRRAVGQ